MQCRAKRSKIGGIVGLTPMASPSHHAEGYNPLCGDRLNLYVQVDGDVITDVAFQGSGCAISSGHVSMCRPQSTVQIERG